MTPCLHMLWEEEICGARQTMKKIANKTYFIWRDLDRPLVRSIYAIHYVCNMAIPVCLLSATNIRHVRWVIHQFVCSLQEISYAVRFADTTGLFHQCVCDLQQIQWILQCKQFYSLIRVFPHSILYRLVRSFILAIGRWMEGRSHRVLDSQPSQDVAI